jgi:hypothetical protein
MVNESDNRPEECDCGNGAWAIELGRRCRAAAASTVAATRCAEAENAPSSRLVGHQEAHAEARDASSYQVGQHLLLQCSKARGALALDAIQRLIERHCLITCAIPLGLLRHSLDAELVIRREWARP